MRTHKLNLNEIFKTSYEKKNVATFQHLEKQHVARFTSILKRKL